MTVLPISVTEFLREAQKAIENAKDAMEESARAKEDKLLELQDKLEQAIKDAAEERKENIHRITSLQREKAEAEAKIDKLEGKLESKRDEIAILKERFGQQPAAESKPLPLEDGKKDAQARKASTPGRSKRQNRTGSQDGHSSASESSGRSQSRGHGDTRRRARDYSQRRSVSKRASRSPPARDYGSYRRDSISPDRRRRRDDRDDSKDGRRGRGRSDSRGRSRSRSGKPWYASKGSKGKGKGKSRDDRETPLCISYVMGKCQWGDKCRDRHPDKENCESAKASLVAKPCRFGKDCKRKDCIFKHPRDGRPPWRDGGRGDSEE